MVGSVIEEFLNLDLVSLLSTLDPFSAAFIAGVGVLIGLDGLRSLRDYWRFRKPATPIYSVVPGRESVEVDGVATPRSDEAVVRSPFTDTPCLVCAYTIEAYYPSVAHTEDILFDPRDVVRPTGWTEVHSGIRQAPFYVDDGSAKILVDPDGATLRLSAHTTTIPDGDDPPEPIREFAEEVAETDENGWAERFLASEHRDGLGRLASLFEWEIEEWSFVEHRLEPGGSVNVSGVVSARRTERDEIGVVHAIMSRTSDDGGVIAQTPRSKSALTISDVSGAALERSLLGWGFVKGAVGAAIFGVGALALSVQFVF